MPVYSYNCRDCGVFDALTPMADHERPVDCPACGHTSPRVVTAPRLAVLGADERLAHARNERSTREPRVSGHDGCCGGGPCAHQGNAGSHGKAPVRGTAASGRPWMLGH